METTTYRDILKRHLSERMENNPRYSLRAFSRDLKISPSRLSEILNGKQGLSEKWARQIASSLQMGVQESEKFCQKVLASDGRAKATRLSASDQLQTQSTDSDYEALAFDTFKVISDWYHYSIIELMKLKRSSADPGWVAKRLGITEYEAKLAIERLVKLGLLHKFRGRLKATGKPLTTTHGIPSEAIRKFNKQILEKAKESIPTQSIEERDISTLTVAVRQKDLPVVMEKIKRFRREMNSYLEDSVGNNGEEVYSLAIQFFRLTQKEQL